MTTPSFDYQPNETRANPIDSTFVDLVMVLH